MGAFSNLIDVSSFFIGILINLLLVAMICYYFKRKIDNLEISQSEQAKMMYTILQRQEQQNTTVNEQIDVQDNSRKNLMVDLGMTSHSYLQNLDLDSLNGNMNEVVENNHQNDEELGIDSESDEGTGDSSSESGSDSDSDNQGQDNDQESLEIRRIEMEPEAMDQSTISKPYEKMTVKELKQIIEEKGITLTRKNLKKNEYIDILLNNSVDEESSVSDVESEVELQDEDTDEAVHTNDEHGSVETLPEEVDTKTIPLDEDDVESVIQSMQSKVDAVLIQGQQINPRTFSLDLDLHATPNESVDEM